MGKGFQILLLMLFLARGSLVSESVAEAPKEWKHDAPIFLEGGISKLALEHNRREIISRELLETNFFRLLAQSCGLSEAETAAATIAIGENGKGLSLYQIGTNPKAFEVLDPQIAEYVCARNEGHTAGFLQVAMSNRVNAAMIPDLELRRLSTNQLWVALSALQKGESQLVTNRAGSHISHRLVTKVRDHGVEQDIDIRTNRTDVVCRRVAYRVIDGEIGWIYHIEFNPDGSLYSVKDRWKCDAKDIDPKYRRLFKLVDDEIKEAMEKDGSYGKLGSCHSFWRMKKELLKTKGISWRSPSELNPGTLFD